MNTDNYPGIWGVAFREYDRYKKVIHQSAWLFGSQIFLLSVGIFSKSIQTMTLGPEGYGLVAFFFTITSFSVLFFRFGLFVSAKVLIANEKDPEKEREMFGATLIMSVIVGLAYSLFIFILSFFVDDLFHVDFGRTLRWLSPFTFILPFQYLVSSLTVGSNRIRLSAMFNIVFKVIHVTLLLIFFFLDSLSVVVLILIYMFSFVVSVIYVMFSLKPVFVNLRDNFRKLMEKEKSYGFHLYLGQIIDQATYKLDGIFITYFVNTTILGFYSLAGLLTFPIVLMSNSLSTSLYKDFASRNRIPAKVLYFNAAWLASSVTILILLRRWLVVNIFSESYLDVVPIIVPLALAGFIHGLSQPYNNFLGANGFGRELRNCSIVMGIVNVAGNITLIPIYGASGAAWASFAGYFVFTTVQWLYYRAAVRPTE